jgi:hypothetical protein
MNHSPVSGRQQTAPGATGGAVFDPSFALQQKEDRPSFFFVAVVICRNGNVRFRRKKRRVKIHAPFLSERFFNRFSLSLF